MWYLFKCLRICGENPRVKEVHRLRLWVWLIPSRLHHDMHLRYCNSIVCCMVVVSVDCVDSDKSHESYCSFYENQRKRCSGKDNIRLSIFQQDKSYESLYRTQMDHKNPEESRFTDWLPYSELLPFAFVHQTNQIKWSITTSPWFPLFILNR